jgi:outer membrane protein assembly factor BamB
MKQHRPSFPRLSGRLHIFPAFIPMIELLPWLLGLVGATAGAARFAFLKEHKKAINIVMAISFVAATGIYFYGETQKPSEAEGSRMVAEADLPKLKEFTAPASVTAGKVYDDFAPVWSVTVKNEPLAWPVVSGDVFMVGTFKGTIDAYARADGKLAWSLQKKEPIFTNILPAGNVGYVGEGLHTAPAAALTAVSLPDGKPLWERQFRSHVESAPAIDEAGHRLWTPVGEEGVYALDTRDGSVLWSKKIGHTDATPLLLDGRLYVSAQPEDGATKAALSSVNPDDGAVDWAVNLPGGTMGSPAEGADGVILLTTAIGQVGPQKDTDKGWSHAISKDGKTLWTVELPGMPVPEPVSLKAKGLVIHTLKTGEIVALNAKDGTQAWHVKVGKEYHAPSSLRDDTVPPLLASITADGIVTLLNAEDGTEIRRFNVKQGGYAAPVFDGDVLYVTTPRSITAYGGVHLLTRGSK